MKTATGTSPRTRAKIIAELASLPSAIQGKICEDKRRLANGATAVYPDFPRSNEKPQDFLGFLLKVFTTLVFLCCGCTLRYLGWSLVGKS